MRLFLTMLLILFVTGDLVAAGAPPRQTPLVHFDTDPERQALSALNVDLGNDSVNRATGAWLKARLPKAIEHPEAVISAMAEWAHRLAFLILPISAILLSAIFLFRQGTYLFDHLIFSMHSLSFQGFLVTVVMAANPATHGGSSLLLVLSPIHLYAHMRGAYGTSVAGTLVRMVVLFTLSSVAFTILLGALVLVAFNGLAAT